LLERLESTYYQEVLTTFTPDDYTAAGFTSSSVPIQEITAVALDEQTHDTLLEVRISSQTHTPTLSDPFVALQEVLSLLSLEPLTCDFDFSKALTSVSTAITVGRTLEYTGVSAYLGSLASINDSDVLTTAASIMTNEGRHQSVMNVLNGNTAIPQAFEMSMLPNEVVTIAQEFFGDVCDTGITRACLTITNPANILTQPLHFWFFHFCVTSQCPNRRPQLWTYHEWHAFAISLAPHRELEQH
jgi:hypothetical protein